MSVLVCAFIEYFSDHRWQLFQPEHLTQKSPAYNFAPESWGKYNFNIYYQQSGEKGLPDDLSIGLKQVIKTLLNQYNDDALNRPSWMSLDELLAFFASDVEGQFAHFDLDYLNQLQETLNADIRVLFWAE